MTINRTTLLDLPLPVTGTEDGTWGDVTNNGLTRYVDIAIAGSLVLSTDADVTLASTEGDSSATNIGSTTAQYSILRCTGSRAATRNINAPAWDISNGNIANYSKTYLVVNETTGGQAVVLRATNSATPTFTTGVTIANGERALCTWNGSDFVIIGATINNLVPIARGGTGTSSTTFVNLASNVTGDLPFSNLAQGSALSVLGVTGNATADVASIAAGTDHQVLRRSGTALGFGAVALNQSAAITGTLPIGNGGTGQTSYTDGQLLIGNTATGGLSKATLTAGSNVTITNGNGTITIASTGGGGGGGGTSVTVTQITATGGQTTFNVTYTVGQLSVYLNGALLASADYTATNGTTVVLAAGAAANDIFTAVAYSTVAGLTLQSASPFGTLVGSGAGAVNTGVNNVFVGFEAGNDNTTGTYNTAVGYQAFDVNTTGYQNDAFGFNALGANTTGNFNSAFGSEALQTNTTGGQNNAFGTGALKTNSTGSFNSAFGVNALRDNTADNNTAVGWNALLLNTTGYENTAVGTNALDANTTGYFNTAIGRDSLGANTTGFRNTCLGISSGDAITTGSFNICIGNLANPSTSSGTDQIVLGYNVNGQANTNVTIGNNNGKIYNAYTVNATWTQTSDGTMKNIIGPDTLGLSFINRLNPIKFTWKPQNELPENHPYYREVNSRDTTTVVHGFVAQDVKAAMDAEGCTTFNGWDQGSDGIQAISREMFISPLVKAIQELSAKCDALQAEIDQLKGN